MCYLVFLFLQKSLDWAARECFQESGRGLGSPWSNEKRMTFLRLSSPTRIVTVPPVLDHNASKKKGLFNQGRSDLRMVSVEGFHPCEEGWRRWRLYFVNGNWSDCTSTSSFQLSKFKYQLVQQPESQEQNGEDSFAPVETRSCSRRSTRSKIFDLRNGIQPAHTIWAMRRRTKILQMKCNGSFFIGSCNATQPSCGFDRCGEGNTAVASLNSAVQAFTIKVGTSRVYLHLSNPSAWRGQVS